MNSNLDRELAWCDEEHPHRGAHHHYVGDFALESYNAASHFVLTLECGSAEALPLPVLRFTTQVGAPNLQVRLTWAQSERLVNMLADAARRYAS